MVLNYFDYCPRAARRQKEKKENEVAHVAPSGPSVSVRTAPKYEQLAYVQAPRRNIRIGHFANRRDTASSFCREMRGF